MTNKLFLVTSYNSGKIYNVGAFEEITAQGAVEYAKVIWKLEGCRYCAIPLDALHDGWSWFPAQYIPLEDGISQGWV